MIKDADSFRKARVKTKVVNLPDSDEQIEVSKMTAGGWIALQAKRSESDDPIQQAMCMVKWGCPIFAGMSVEEVAEIVPADDAMFIAGEVMALSGLDEDAEKN